MIDVWRALFRGRYTKAVAHIERNGIPFDTAAYSILMSNWDRIKQELASKIDSEFGVYQGTTFKIQEFVRYLQMQGITDWPQTKTGFPKTDSDTFDIMSLLYPQVKPLGELLSTMRQLRKFDIPLGSDGRVRCSLMPFGTITGRNNPKRSPFGLPAWFRGFIRPEPGMGLAYIDYEQQEFAVAAYLSGDVNMISAYQSGDPYIAFAKQAGAVPPDATKASHPVEREIFKICALGVNYGMGSRTLARNIGRSQSEAGDLIRKHQQTYSRFWEWVQEALDCANLNGTLQTVFGWKIHPGPRVKERTLRNFPAQANGSEILRLASILTTESEIAVAAPIHDALLVEGSLDELDEIVAETQRLMAKASGMVLGGPELRTEATIVRYPNRYMDPRGEEMWNLVWDIIGGSPD